VRQVIKGSGNMPAYARTLSLPSAARVAFMSTRHKPTEEPARDSSRPAQASIENVQPNELRKSQYEAVTMSLINKIATSRRSQDWTEDVGQFPDGATGDYLSAGSSLAPRCSMAIRRARAFFTFGETGDHF